MAIFEHLNLFILAMLNPNLSIFRKMPLVSMGVALRLLKIYKHPIWATKQNLYNSRSWVQRNNCVHRSLYIEAVPGIPGGALMPATGTGGICPTGGAGGIA